MARLARSWRNPRVEAWGRLGKESSLAEFTEVYQIEADFKEKVESEFNKMIERVAPTEG